MAVALLTTAKHALLLSLLLLHALRVSTSNSPTPDCGNPKMVENTNFEKPETNVGYIRYKCQKGFKRSAGTSNLAVCVFDDTTNMTYWKYGNILCIRDPSLPPTTARTLTSPTTTDDSSEALTTHSTLTPQTTTGPTSSRDFTSSDTELERLPTTSTATTRGHQTRQMSKTKSSRTTQVPGQFYTTKETSHRTTEGQTTHDAAGTQVTKSSPTTAGEPTVRTTSPSRSSEHVTTSREATQTEPESTNPSTETVLTSALPYYTTTAQDPSVPDTSLWRLERTAGSIAGVFVFLVLLVIIIIWRKRRNQHSPVAQQEPDPIDNYSDAQEEGEEDSTAL